MSTAPNAPRNRLPHTQRGVTLIEACTVLAIAGIVASSALPAFDGMTELRTLEGRAAELGADLQGLRADAVARNRVLRINYGSAAEGSCYVIHTGSADACTCSGDAPAQCAGNTEVLKTVALPSSGPVRLEANVHSMAYDPAHGTTTVGGTIRLTDRQGRSIRHIVSIMGRVRSCSPEGQVRGYRPC